MALPVDVPIPISDSSWVESTEPAHGETGVSRVDDIVIRLTRLIDVSCLVSEIFRLTDDTGAVVEPSFREISVVNDYNPITGELVLHLAEPLDTLSQYTFTIDGLFDVAGDSQDRPHVVTFTTNANEATLDPIVTDNDVIGVIDKTLSPTANLVEQSTTAHNVYMDPVDGSYNVAATTQTIAVRFSPPDITEAELSVKKRIVSRFETPWQDTGATYEFVDGSVVITMPQASSGVYIEPGYEYQVNVTFGEELVTMYFIGELTPMLGSVQSVLIQEPSWSAYEVARMLYLNTAIVTDVDRIQATRPTKAGTDYVLYATLWQVSTTGSSASFVLGDLEVDRSKEESKDKRWERLMEEAWRRLARANPKFVNKGGAHTSPHASRDWGEPVSPRRRTSGPIAGD